MGSVACSLGQAEAALPNPASTPYISWPVEATKQATAEAQPTEAQPTPTAGPTSTAAPSPTPQPPSKPPAIVEAVVEATIEPIAPTTVASTATPQSPTPTPIRATPTPRPRLVWQEADRWTGTKILTTGNFRVRADEWRITWATEPGEFAFKIKLHNSNQMLKTVVIDEINPEPNSMVFRRPGDDYDYTDYYLVIIADQPYTVIVEELR